MSAKEVGLPPLIFPFTIIIVYFYEKCHCNWVICILFDEVVGEMGLKGSPYLCIYLGIYLGVFN